jgi:hypothetical protein
LVQVIVVSRSFDSSDDILKQILIKTIYKFITLLCVNYITLHYINLRHLLLIVLEYEKIGFFLPKIKIHLMSQAPKGQFLLNEKESIFSIKSRFWLILCKRKI